MKSYIVTIVLGFLLLSPMQAVSHDKSNDVSMEATVSAIRETMQQYVYDPKTLRTPEYARIERSLIKFAETQPSKDDFVAYFNRLWEDGPFSHVQLSNATTSADNLARYLDSLNVGGGGAVLNWEGSIAILTVTTMMGQDTIEEVNTAYDSIMKENAAALIIDLRANEGGAFAVKPLIQNMISESFEAGGFVSRQWNNTYTRAPELSDLTKVAPWQGWSILKFWRDIQENPLVRIQFSPNEKSYSGDVYVLTSEKTASAAELAVDAVKRSGRVTVIGETTAGKMLSQKPYDIAGGFHLYLPVADYYSVQQGRIENIGVKPDINVESENALQHALKLINEG
jgi:hypothetical protein